MSDYSLGRGGGGYKKENITHNTVSLYMGKIVSKKYHLKMVLCVKTCFVKTCFLSREPLSIPQFSGGPSSPHTQMNFSCPLKPLCPLQTLVVRFTM